MVIPNIMHIKNNDDLITLNLAERKINYFYNEDNKRTLNIMWFNQLTKMSFINLLEIVYKIPVEIKRKENYKKVFFELLSNEIMKNEILKPRIKKDFLLLLEVGV